MAVKKRKIIKRKVQTGLAYIQCSFNNTIVTITDVSGNVIAWSTTGLNGFRGSKKNTAYAAQVTAEDAGKKAMKRGLKTVSIYVKGPGSGREGAIRAFGNLGFDVTLLRDVTPIPHNGCRPKKKRRV